MRITRISLFVFAAIVMLFSTIMSDELALLARVSFTGTAMMAPIVLMAVISKAAPPRGIIIVSVLALSIYLLSMLGVVPGMIAGLRLDLALYLFLVISTLVIVFLTRNREDQVSHQA